MDWFAKIFDLGVLDGRRVRDCNGSRVYFRVEIGKGFPRVEFGERISGVIHSHPIHSCAHIYSFFGHSSCSSSGPSAVLAGMEVFTAGESFQHLRDHRFGLKGDADKSVAIKLFERYFRSQSDCEGARIIEGKIPGIEGNFASPITCEVASEWIGDFIVMYGRENWVQGCGVP
jgi:hypothetical protein